MAVLSAVIGVCAVRLIPWWSTAIPSGLLLVFVVVARISVRVMRRKLDARYRDIRQGSNESTMFLSRKDFAKRGADSHSPAARPTELQAGPSVGPRPDHHADIRLQAARSPDRPHHRPLRSGRGHLAGPEVPVTADAPAAPPRHLERCRRRRNAQGCLGLTVVKSRC